MIAIIKKEKENMAENTVRETKSVLKDIKKLLKELLKLEENYGMAFKDFPEDEQQFVKLEMEVVQLRIKQFKQIIAQKEKDIINNKRKDNGTILQEGKHPRNTV
tara:strand:+ start:537 stop:848 length:312 start_codon:yes stop_codon:yes gene_type:complete